MAELPYWLQHLNQPWKNHKIVIPECRNRGSSNSYILLMQGSTNIDGAMRNERTGFPLRACGNDVVVICVYVPRFIEALPLFDVNR